MRASPRMARWRVAAGSAGPGHVRARTIRRGPSPSSIRSRRAAAPTCWRGMVAGKLEQRLGKTFVVENKTGAGSIIAAVAVQKSAPDGYTLLMAPTPTMATNVALYKSLPYEPQTDFIPLALLGQTPFVLLVNPALPVKSVGELIAYSKANPGKLSFASVGPGVPHHLYMEMLKSMTGIDRVACALSRQPAGAERRDRRPRADDVLRSRPCDRRAAGRHAFGRLACRRRSGCRASRISRRSPRTVCRASTRSAGRCWSRRPRRRARSSTSSTAR